jgi:cytochrome c6
MNEVNGMSKNQRKMGAGFFSGIIILACFAASGAWAADPQQGGKLYTKNCKNCHGADGVAQMPGIPDFKRGERLLRSDNDLLQFIRNGSGMMPAYRGLLSDREILDVISYLRTLRR